MANFFASGLFNLREKLGPILWQLPPNFHYDRARLAAFFDLLPRDTDAAARLACKHDERLNGRCVLEAGEARPMRHALEVRHRTFETAEFVHLLRAHDIALVVADTAGKWPFMEDVTSDFIYVRLHGADELYVSGYSESALEEWARKVRGWSEGEVPDGTRLWSTEPPPPARSRDVYVYFDNDVKVRAPHDAISLAHHLALGEAPDAPPDAAAIAEVARTHWPALPTPRRSKRARAGGAG
jgi:uncharacterized protein YecE (DUF72 family)